MSERKLTPAEAFEMLKAVFPWLTKIKRSEDAGVHLCRNTESVAYLHVCNIDWNSDTSYPDKWRPATIEDIKRAIDGDSIECRVGVKNATLVGGHRGFLGALLFNVKVNSSSFDVYSNVEVRE